MNGRLGGPRKGHETLETKKISLLCRETNPRLCMEVLKNVYVDYLPTNVNFILLEDSFNISWHEDDPEGQSKRVVLLLCLEYDRWGGDVTWQFLIRYNSCQAHSAKQFDSHAQK